MRTTRNSSAAASCEPFFFTHMFGNRIMSIEIPLDKYELDLPLNKTVHFDNGNYELISTKIVADGNK
jgi:hypothetical protein